MPLGQINDIAKRRISPHRNPRLAAEMPTQGKTSLPFRYLKNYFLSPIEAVSGHAG